MKNDYIDFKFGDHWASEFNLLAVSNSDRYNPPIYGSVNPNTAAIMGKKGVYKWKTQVNEKVFNINIAFDSVTIAQLNLIKQWLEPHKIEKLVFSEEPYKYYWAALNSEIDFTHLPFVEDEIEVDGRTIIQGVYKGEMVIQFVCIDNDGYSTEGNFEEVEGIPEFKTAKGKNFVITDADNDYIEDLKIEGKSKQESKFNNTLSDTNFSKMASNIAKISTNNTKENNWETNNLATVTAKDGEATITAPYEYSGIAQEQREAIVGHKYYASAEVNTNNINTALEIAGKNITNSVSGKDIDIDDGLVGRVDDLRVEGNTEQEIRYDNEINSSFLEGLDNWNNVEDATATVSHQAATIDAKEKYAGIAQQLGESNIGDKYYFSAKLETNQANAALEIETEQAQASGECLTIKDSSNRKVKDFKLYGKTKQDTYEEQELGTGNDIELKDNEYMLDTRVNVSGATYQETAPKQEGTTISSDAPIYVSNLTTNMQKTIISGNSYQEKREGYNLLDKPKQWTLSGSTQFKYNEVIPAGTTLTISCGKVVCGGSANEIAVDFREVEDTSKVIQHFSLVSNTVITYTLPKDTKVSNIYSNGYNYSASQGVTSTVENLMIAIGEQKEYEKYGVMPSTKLPSEITDCGENGNNLIFKLSNRNIFDNVFNVGKLKEDGTFDSKETSYSYSNFIEVANGNDLIVHWNDIDAEVSIVFYEGNLNYISYQDLAYTETPTGILVPSKAKYFVLGCNKDTTYMKGVNIQAEYNTKTSYIAHEEKTVIIPLTDVLRGYDDARDSIEKRKGTYKLVKRVGVEQFTGEEAWKLNLTQTNTIRFSLGISYLNAKSLGLCNKLFVRTTQAHGDYEYINITNNILYVNVPKASLSEYTEDAEGFKALLAQWNTAGAPLKIYYALMEEEESDLTTEQITALEKVEKMNMYMSKTVVSCADGKVNANLDLTYNYHPGTPSVELPSIIRNCGDNVNFIKPAITQYSSQGIDFTTNEKGRIVANGTCSSESNSIMVLVPYSDSEITKAGEYTFSIPSSLYDNYYARIEFSTSTSSDDRILLIDVNLQNDFNRTFDLEQDAYFKVSLVVNAGTTAKNLDITPKLELGGKATAYSPYGYGNMQITLSNKNLLNIKEVFNNTTYYSIDEMKQEVTLVNKYDTRNWETAMPNRFIYEPGTYILKTTNPCQMQIQGNGEMLINKSDINTATFTLKERGPLKIKLIKPNEELPFKVGKVWLLHKDSDNVSYIEHQEQKFIFPFKEKQVLCEDDYLASDGIHQLRRKIELDTINKWEIPANQGDHVETILVKALINNALFLNAEITCISNMFEARSNGNWRLEGEAIWIGSNYINVSILRSRLKSEDSDGIKVFFTEQKEKGNPVIVEYKLQNEVIEPYTEEQQEIYNELIHLYLYKGDNRLFANDEIAPTLQWLIPKRPSIEYPVAIQNVGEAVNLFDKNNPNALNLYFHADTPKLSSNSNRKTVYIPCEKNTTYTLSTIASIRSNNTWACGYITEEPATNILVKSVQASANNVFTITTGPDAKYLVAYIYNTGYGNSYEEVIDNLKIEKSNRKGLYSDYNCGSIGIRIDNGNMVNTEKLSKMAQGSERWEILNANSFTIDLSKSGLLFITDLFFDNLSQGQYTLSYHRTHTNTAFSPGFSFAYDDGSREASGLGAQLDTNCVITSNPDKKITGITLTWNTQNQGGQATFTDFQLVRGDAQQAFINNKQTLVNFPLKEGQVLHEGDYLADDGTHHKRKTIELDGTEDWKIYGDISTHRFYLTLHDLKIWENPSIASPNILCNQLKSVPKNHQTESNNNISINNVSKLIIIRIDETYSDVKKFTDFLKSQKENGTPIKIEYELEEEIIEPYSPEQQQAYNQIKTYRDTTNFTILDDLEPQIELTYTKAPTIQLPTTKVNTQQSLSVIFDTKIDDTRILATNLSANEALIKLSKPVLVNLTKLKEEHDLQWCDENLSFFNCAEGGAPSIETPSRVQYVGDNVNLFDPSKHIEFTGHYRNQNGAYCTNAEWDGLKIPVKGDTIYTASSNLPANKFINLCYYDENYKYMWGYTWMNEKDKTFRTPNKCRYISVAIHNDYEYFKLEYGSVATTKSDYGLANIDTTITGYDTQFRSFPLSEGQRLDANSYLSKDGIHKKWEKIVVDGETNKVSASGTNTKNLNRFAVVLTDKFLTCDKGNSIAYCEQLPLLNAGETAINLDGFTVSNANDRSEIYFYSEPFAIKNADEMNAYLKENPITFFLPLETEKVETYTTAQKEWYDNFSIYRKNTQISTQASTKPWYSFTYDINDTYIVKSTKTNAYEKLGLIFDNLEDRPRFIVNSTADVNSTIKMRKPLVVDLTNEFGTGQEPDLTWCKANLTFEKSCEYGSPSPVNPSEVLSVGSNQLTIENKNRNLISQPSIANWKKQNCTVTKIDEKYQSNSVFRINYNNHATGMLSLEVQERNKDLVFGMYVRVIQADDPTVNRITIAKETGSNQASTIVSYKNLENSIGEWQKVYVPVTKSNISTAAAVVLGIQHNALTDDSTIIDITMPQLEEGLVPHDYLPYAPGQRYNLVFSQPLMQLPNGVKDEFSKAGIVRRVGKYTINGNENVYWVNFNSNPNYITASGQLGIYIRGDSTTTPVSFYCDKIKDCIALYDIARDANTPSRREKEGIGIIDSEYRLCLRADLIGILPNDNSETRARKYKLWLQDNPITIYYPKETEEIEPLTELQSNVLNSLITRTKYNNWSISGDLEPEMELTYRISSATKPIHPWVTASNLLDKTWLYNDNNIHTKPYVEGDTGNAQTSGVSADRPVYLLNSGTSIADLNLKFDYISIVSPLTIIVTKGYFTDDGFTEQEEVSRIVINPFLNYQPFIDLYDNNAKNWCIEIDSTLGEVYLKHKTDETKVLNLNRFNANHTFLTLAKCNFVDYKKPFPTIISEIKDTAIENTVFNKLTVLRAPEAYRLKNASIEWKHTYL